MTATQSYLAQLPAETYIQINAIFGSIEKFYQFIYLIAQNEHNVQLLKLERPEERLATIHHVQERIEQLVDSFELSGYDVMADIKSDYLEDWIAQRPVETHFTNEEFVALIHKFAY